MKNNHLAQCNNLTRINLAVERVDVTDSQIIAARFNNHVLRDFSWHAIAAVAYEEAYDLFSAQGFQHLSVLQKLSDVSGYTVMRGEHAGGSYTYFAAIRGSIQRRSACQSLDIATYLARATDSTFEIAVRLAPGADKYSGQEGVLWWTPEADAAELDRLLAL